MGYPVVLNLTGRRCIIVGGGRVAERKAKRLIESGAAVTVIAPEATENLQVWASEKKLLWRQQPYTKGCLKGAFLVFVAAASREVCAEAAQEARTEGALLNDAVEPARSDFAVPASVRRGDLLLTVSTGGGSPELSRCIRQELEAFYPESFGAWLERVASVRQEMKDRLCGSSARQAFWRHAMDARLLECVRNGQLDHAEDELRNAVIGFGTES